MTRRIHVWYIVYWGAAEPLGQSLVVPALLQLARMGVEITLFSYDKPADLSNAAEIQRICAELSGHGIRWVTLGYHKRPKWPATFFDVLNGVLRGVVMALRQPPHLIHGRTFVGGIIGLALAAAIRRPFVFHNEGFYPDEQVDGGVWRLGSPAHRLARSIEGLLYRTADGIIVLSRRARAQVERLPYVAGGRKPVVVVPSCVDLDRFRWRGPAVRRSGEPLRLVYVGSIGARYVFERVGEFMAAALRRLSTTHLRVLTPAPPEDVASILFRCGVPREAWDIARVPYAKMPGELAQRHAGIMVLTQGLSEHGCSPTKVGEYWAVGLPVVITPNISDTEEIIRAHRVGVVIKGPEPACYEDALDGLMDLMQDPDLPARCRQAAERYYSLAPAVEAQRRLYEDLAFTR